MTGEMCIMSRLFDKLSFDLLSQWEYLVLYVAAAAIASGVAINFAIYYDQPGKTVAAERNAVATLAMTLFFVAMYLFAQFGIGRPTLSASADLAARLSGCVLVVFAAAINIAGRVALGRFWSNQIEIVEAHRVVRSWPYSWSRHPLYGSLIIFGVGMGFLSLNPIVVVATLLIFLPAMRHRAMREEALLVDACENDYRQFQRQVPMLLPHLSESASKVARGLLAVMQVWAAVYVLLDVFIISATLTFGLSFMMERDAFRLAYKFKPLVILFCVATAYMAPSLAILLWLPAAASLMSLSGHCPGTLLVEAIEKRVRGANG